MLRRARARLTGTAIVAAEQAFVAGGRRADPRRASNRPRACRTRPISELRGCPYRYLLGRVLRLRRAEALEPSYTRLEYGQLAHDVMRVLPGARRRGLARARRGGRRGGRGASCGASPTTVRASGLPQARLWRETFVALVPELVAGEIARADPVAAGRARGPVHAHPRRDRRLAARRRAATTDAAVPAGPSRAGADRGPDRPPRSRARRFAARGGDRLQDRAVRPRPPTCATGSNCRWCSTRWPWRPARCTGLEPAPGGGRWRVDHGGYYGLRADAVGMPRGPQLPRGRRRPRDPRSGRGDRCCAWRSTACSPARLSRSCARRT